MASPVTYTDELHTFLDTGLDYLARWDMPAVCLVVEDNPHAVIPEIGTLLDQRGIVFDEGVESGTEPAMYSHILAEVDTVPNLRHLLRKSRSHGCTIILVGDAEDYATATRENWAVSLFIDGRPGTGQLKAHAPSSLMGVPGADPQRKA